MSTSATNAGLAVIGHVIIAIDECIGEDPQALLTEDQQTKFLANFASTWKCFYNSRMWRGSKTPWHDQVSLLRSLTGSISTKGRMRDKNDKRSGKAKVNDLFARGSGVLDETYLESALAAAAQTPLELQDTKKAEIEKQKAEDAEREEAAAVMQQVKDDDPKDSNFVPHGEKQSQKSTSRYQTRGNKKKTKAPTKAPSPSLSPSPLPPAFKKTNFQAPSTRRKSSENSANRAVSPHTQFPSQSANRLGSELTWDGGESSQEDEDEDQDAEGEEEEVPKEIEDEIEDEHEHDLVHGSLQGQRRTHSIAFPDEEDEDSSDEDEGELYPGRYDGHSSTTSRHKSRKADEQSSPRGSPSLQEQETSPAPSSERSPLNNHTEVGSNIEVSRSSQRQNQPSVQAPASADSPVTAIYSPQNKAPSVQDLENPIRELNSMIAETVANYVPDAPLSEPADVVHHHPTSELEELYREIFGRDWKATVADLQLQRALQATGLLRALIAAFISKNVLATMDNLSWLNSDTALMFKAVKIVNNQDEADELLKKWLSAEAGLVFKVLNERLSSAGTRDGLTRDTFKNLFKDERLIHDIVEPQAQRLAVECLLTLNGHLGLVWRSSPPASVGIKFRGNLVEIFELALRIQTRLMIEMKDEKCIWSPSTSPYDDKNMKVDSKYGEETDGDGEGYEAKAYEVAFTIFPGIDWLDKGDQRSIEPLVALVKKAKARA